MQRSLSLAFGPCQLAGLAFVSFFFVLMAAPALAQPPAKVVLDPAQMQVIEQQRAVTGEIRALRRSLLASQEDGIVVSLSVAEGDPIGAGEVVARLDDQRARLELVRAETVVAAVLATERELMAQLDRARSELERVRELAEEGSASPQELDDAVEEVGVLEARFARSEADRAAAEADKALAERTLRDMTIRAPFKARVVSKRTEEGQWVSRGDPVIELIDIDQVEAWVDVPVRYAAAVSEPGSMVSLAVPGLDVQVKAPITQVLPIADARSRLLTVRVRLANASGLLKPGMSIDALIPTGEERATLTVHKDAILRDDAGLYVYFDGGGSAVPARIDRLFAVDNRVAIRQGQIQPGMPVIIKGNERMYPTQPLIVLRPGEEPDQSSAPQSGQQPGQAPGDAPGRNDEQGGG